MSIHFLLILGHLIGTILGVGGATMIEIQLNKALQDGKMDAGDRTFLGSDFFITRIGMALAILTGFGFIIEYWMNNQLFRLENGVFWAKMAIIVIIAINAYLLHKHKIGLYWGSAFSFVSWWTAMILGTFLTNGIRVLPADQFMSFFAIMIVYICTVALGAQTLHLLRERMKRRYAVLAQTEAIPEKSS
jgi:hypothetical protein